MKCPCYWWDIVDGARVMDGKKSSPVEKEVCPISGSNGIKIDTTTYLVEKPVEIQGTLGMV